MREFIGRGWGFPPTFRKETGGVEMLDGKADIQSSIELILSTMPGERVMRPDFGAGMERLIMEPFNLTLKTYMENVVKRAIVLHEPRVILDVVNLEAVPLEGLIRIDIRYTVASTNSRDNFVFPFYISEGTDLNS